MRVALMIEGQEGVTWEHWCALADACEEHGIETLFRSDHYISRVDEDGNVAHDAWTTIAGARRAHDDAALRHARLARHLPAAGAARERGRDGRSRLRRADRARARRRLDGARAPRLRLPVPRDVGAARDVRRAARDRAPPLDRGARRLPRRALHARGRAGAARSPCSSRIRRCSSAAAARAALPSPPRASPTSTTRRSCRPTTSRASAPRSSAPARHRPHAALLDDDRLPHRRDARRGARARAPALRTRPRDADFDDWLAATRSARSSARSTRSPTAPRVRARGLRARDAPAPAAHRPRAGALIGRLGQQLV